jgi:DNA-3-methyladenine glycosylase II
MINTKGFYLHVVEPYDFALSLKAVRSFQPFLPEAENQMRLAARVEGTTVLIEAEQGLQTNNKLKISSTPEVNPNHLRRTMEWALFGELDLGPFYRLISLERKLSFITRKLHGLKPMRPVSLFEMAVIAITEQQISLAAAYRIRSRFIQQFGEAIGYEWVFPEPGKVARAGIEEIRAPGLSRQKAQYIQELAAKIADGKLDLDILKTLADDDARQTIMSWRGFGRWSADYILVRGLARPDCVPIDDLAIRSVVGTYLGDGQRVTPEEAGRILEPFRPYRGLLAYYLLAEHRISVQTI